MDESPSVTVIILNYNRLADTRECLAFLRKVVYPRVSTIVVDNHSTEAGVSMLAEEFPEVELMVNEANLGFAEGNNRALRRALERGADYMLLLNNDTVVAPDFLSLLVAAAEADPSVGMVGPTICYFQEPETIWSAGGHIDWDKGTTGMLHLNRPERECPDNIGSVDFVSGCALLVKREVLEKVGLIDPRFFMYWEEVDWCVRTRRAGYEILHVPQSRLWHKISPVQQAASPFVAYYMARNRLLFLRKAKVAPLVWVRALLDELRTIVSLSLLPRYRHLRAQRNALVLALLDFMRGRFGKSKALEPVV